MKKIVVSVFVIAVLAALLSGCGGGGGGGGGNSAPRLIQGVANIHHDSERPMVAFLFIDPDGNPNTVGTPVFITRPDDGWKDENFALLPPVAPNNDTIYAIVAFNDESQDRKFQPSELLGYADSFLYWNPSVKKWQIIESETANLIWPDAFAQGGKDNIFIDADHRRVSSLNTPESRTAKQVAVYEQTRRRLLR